MPFRANIHAERFKISMITHCPEAEIELIFLIMPRTIFTDRFPRRLRACYPTPPNAARSSATHADDNTAPIATLADLFSRRRNGNHRSSSLELASALSGFASWVFQTLLARSRSMSGNTRSNTSEYQLAACPSMPSLMFYLSMLVPAMYDYR